MINDLFRREAILKSFPEIKLKARDEIEQEVLPHYVFYTTISKTKKECYCTHCRQHYIESPNNRTYTAVIKHNADGKCLQCGHPITFHSNGYGRGKIKDKRNVAILRPVGQDMYIRCYTVKQSFFNKGDDIPDVDYRETQRYYLTKGECQKWGWQYKWTGENGWVESWNIMQTDNEPNFINNNSFGRKDNSYKIIGEEQIDKTFLKYSQVYEYNNYAGRNGDCIKYIAYLCYYAKHPNVEYLMKTGFIDLVVARLERRLKYYINWRSNDVKRMLKLTKEEMKVLAGITADTLTDYNTLKKFAPSFSSAKLLETTKLYWQSVDSMAEINRATKLNLEQILNYSTKQKNIRSTFFSDWRDYLRECITLDYDVLDTAISKPKSLSSAHERTSSLITIKQNDETDALMIKRARKLDNLIFTDEKRGFTIVIPQSVQDIVTEGKELKHCVGGYADRHAKGTLNILFLRKTTELDKPFYTIEVSTDGYIRQCRGFKNNRSKKKPKVIEDFEKAYQKFLDSIFKQNKKRSVA